MFVRGFTSLRRSGVSINEAGFPNLCLRWSHPRILYIALSRRLKWHKVF
jgi:hypothetical protein